MLDDAENAGFERIPPASDRLLCWCVVYDAERAGFRMKIQGATDILGEFGESSNRCEKAERSSDGCDESVS